VVEAVGGTERSPLMVRPVHLVEKVCAQFKNEVKKDAKRWVLDSRASNHMVGSERYSPSSTPISTIWSSLVMVQ
jgi:hypothetical protein